MGGAGMCCKEGRGEGVSMGYLSKSDTSLEYNLMVTNSYILEICLCACS